MIFFHYAMLLERMLPRFTCRLFTRIQRARYTQRIRRDGPAQRATRQMFAAMLLRRQRARQEYACCRCHAAASATRARD